MSERGLSQAARCACVLYPGRIDITITFSGDCLLGEPGEGYAFKHLAWSYAVAGALLAAIRVGLFAALSLCLACIPILFISRAGWPPGSVRVPGSVMRVLETLARLRSLWALVAGWGLGFSIHRRGGGKDMTDWDKAITFVHQRGNRLARLRLRRALGEPYTLIEAEEVLTPYQFPDGSWDYNVPEEKSDRIGSLGGTIHCLRWLREFGLGTSPQMVRTLEFLASIQAPDGSFYETEVKLAHSPQEWLQEEALIDRFYFTAAVPMRLLSLGHREHSSIVPALRWLRLHWTDWELVTGTWYNLWALLCLHPTAIGLSISQYQRCYAMALDWLPHLEAQPLTWLLDALHGAGFLVDEPLVARGIARLQTLQGEDGTWPDSHYSTVETTVTALRLLRDYGNVPVREGEG